MWKLDDPAVLAAERAERLAAAAEAARRKLANALDKKVTAGGSSRPHTAVAKCSGTAALHIVV